ncbi:sentrin-specific protease 7b isoform X2 [Salarias fasciatus]|uniref:Sentrin-specific protease 7-like n=1 Tax=Salarias fasciatus TaxID=181472 RepID=A0A672GSN0_SALFA|nr:sentrin-specific protease 7-like isoform X2 [Salarias fasciatus]
MAAPFKIPRKKDTADSSRMHVQSPLSRLHSPYSHPQGYEDQSGRGVRMHAGKAEGSSSDTQRFNGTGGGRGTAANHRAPQGPSGPSQQRGRSESSFSNGWRPKRASDRLLSPEREKSAPSGAPMDRVLSVDAVDSLAALRGAKHTGSSSKDDQKKWGAALDENSSSEDDFRSPPRPSSSSSVSMTTGGGGSSLLLEDVRERQRARWQEFREKRDRRSHSGAPKHKRRPSEPIVLSSEDEDKDTTTPSGRPSGAQRSSKALKSSSFPAAAPTFLQLDFLSLHIGPMDASANGTVTISESGITIPLKGSEEAEEVEVTVVASQLRGYGVWDGGVVRDRPLLAAWKGPAPSLLFLWVTSAQANVLQRELVTAWSDGAAGIRETAAGPPCCFLLLVLKEQLQELQAALLASILDMREYQRGRSSSSSSCGGPDSPLDWAGGLLLLHSSLSPLDQHLLRLLGHSTSEETSGGQKTRSALQTLPTRLIQYPKAPCKGRITVTREDLVCLNHGEFLNDVIIDFYLKYLLLEGAGGAVAERSHVFSSFLYKQLSRGRGPGEDDAPSVPDRRMRHQRVKTWTRHVDIFAKDFLFVPVNQAAHWFLVVVCFPGLQESRYEDFERPSRQSNGGSESRVQQQQQQLPECTMQGCARDTVLKRPCILVMDSLKLSYHRTVCKLIRDYLQVEWDVRRRTPRLFTEETMRSCSCRVPLQDNSSDCGVYLLQYTHSFLQNPVVHFDLPLRLDGWFPRQCVRQKREEIRSLILRLKEEADRK